MSRHRTAALAVGAWLLVVTASATLAWTVISQAGEGVAGVPPGVEAGPSQSSPSPSDEASTPTSSPSSSPSGGPSASQPVGDPVRRTWQGAGGVVVAECTGAAIALLGTHPASGWKFEIDDTGPDDLRVEFETIDERTRVRVEGHCVAGAPEFSVDTRTKG